MAYPLFAYSQRWGAHSRFGLLDLLLDSLELASSSLYVPGLSKTSGSPWPHSSSGVCRPPFRKCFGGISGSTLHDLYSQGQPAEPESWPRFHCLSHHYCHLGAHCARHLLLPLLPVTWAMKPVSSRPPFPSEGCPASSHVQLGVLQLVTWLQGISVVTQSVMVFSVKGTAHACSQGGQLSDIPPPAAEPDPTSPLGL